MGGVKYLFTVIYKKFFFTKSKNKAKLLFRKSNFAILDITFCNFAH